jgi:hypothetical protein
MMIDTSMAEVQKETHRHRRLSLASTFIIFEGCCRKVGQTVVSHSAKPFWPLDEYFQWTSGDDAKYCDQSITCVNPSFPLVSTWCLRRRLDIVRLSVHHHCNRCTNSFQVLFLYQNPWPKTYKFLLTFRFGFSLLDKDNYSLWLPIVKVIMLHPSNLNFIAFDLQYCWLF